jgi:hypothetical protein
MAALAAARSGSAGGGWCCSAGPQVHFGHLDGQLRDLQSCSACVIDLARRPGAQLAVIGWVQKVSNLILNLNAPLLDVAAGRIVAGGSVDIRGNTDESWSRGLTSLVRERLLASPWQVSP